MTPATDTVKQIGDGVSIGVWLAAIAGWLPAAAAGASLIWTAMRVAEMWTGKKFHEIVASWKTARKARKRGG